MGRECTKNLCVVSTVVQTVTYYMISAQINDLVGCVK